MSILHKDHKTDESEIKFKFLSDSVLKAFEKDNAFWILDFGFWIGRDQNVRRKRHVFDNLSGRHA